jgi:hypothetical protein
MSGYGYGISVSGSRTPVVASSTPAPTTLPLSTPNLYFSGLTFPYSWVNEGYTYYIDTNSFTQAYERNSNTQWRGNNFAYVQDQLSYNGSIWNLTVKCQIDDGYDVFDGSISVATNNASGTAIPLTGWQNQAIVLSGTLVISTTP